MRLMETVSRRDARQIRQTMAGAAKTISYVATRPFRSISLEADGLFS